MSIEVTHLFGPTPASGLEGKITILTDSVAQVPAETARQLDIRIVPSTITFDGRTYLDGVDLDPDDLYRRMRLEKELQVTTSAPSAGQFYQAFLGCLDSGAGTVLYLGLTSRLSGTFSAAVGGALLSREEFGDRQIVLVDTHIATIAQGFLVISAARLAAEGASLEAILEHVRLARTRTGLAAGLETLEYLARGGRIGRVAYMLGSAIHILPVVTIDENGEVSPIGRAHSHHHMLEQILHYVEKHAAGCPRLRLAVMHSDSLSYAEQLQTLAAERLHPQEMLLTSFTPVMGAHAGPGLLGLAYYGEEYEN